MSQSVTYTYHYIFRDRIVIHCFYKLKRNSKTFLNDTYEIYCSPYPHKLTMNKPQHFNSFSFKFNESEIGIKSYVYDMY